MAVLDTDLFLVSRGGTNYKVNGATLKAYAGTGGGTGGFFVFDSYAAPFANTGTYLQQGNMANSENCICCLASDGIWRTTDGLNWTKVSLAQRRDDVTITESGAGAPGQNMGPKGIAYGGNGVWIAYETPNLGSLRSTDDGLTWSPITIPAVSASFAGICGSLHLGQPAFFVCSGGANFGGTVTSQISLDGGVTWTPLSNAPLPPNGVLFGVYALNTAAMTDPATGEIVLGAAVAGQSVNLARAAYLYVSTDQGLTWTSYGGLVPDQNNNGCSTQSIGGGDGVLALVAAAQNGYGQNAGGSIVSQGFYFKNSSDNGTFEVPNAFDSSELTYVRASASCIGMGEGAMAIQGYLGSMAVYDKLTFEYSSYSQSNSSSFASSIVIFQGKIYWYDGVSIWRAQANTSPSSPANADSWITVPSVPASNDWRGSTFSGSLFVLVGDQGEGAYSADGANWSPASGLSGGVLEGVAYGNSKFVAADRGNGVFWSTNGISWNQQSIGGDNFYGVAYGLGLFVVVGENSGATGCSSYYSADAVNWSGNGNIMPGGRFTSVTFGGGKFVAVDSQGRVAYTSDGSTWSIVGDITPGGEGLNGVSYGNGVFIAVGEGGLIYRSLDGISWVSLGTVPGVSSTNYRGVGFGGGTFVAVGNDGLIVKSYNLGVTWSPSVSGTTSGLRTVTFGNGKFVVAGDPSTGGVILNSIP